MAKEPFISSDLLTWLKTTFPNQLPTSLDIELRELSRLQGIQHVIQVLQNLHDEQNNNSGE